jgi:hypothetical protein
MTLWRKASVSVVSIFFACTVAAPAETPATDAQPLARMAFHGTTNTLKYDRLTITLSKESLDDPKLCRDKQNTIPCSVLTAKGQYDGKLAFQLFGADEAASTEDGDWAPSISIWQLDPTAVVPQIVLSYYTGGAHCCMVFKVATVDEGEKWHVVDAGYHDGDVGYRFIDVTHDGGTELIGVDDSFLYKFASHAGSYVPTKVSTIKSGQLVDVTKDAKFHPFLVRELRRMEDSAKQSPISEINGFLAGWVAQKALVGEVGEAWSRMLASYDRRARDGLELCRVEERVWIKSPFPQCPQGQQYTVIFPEALAVFLVQHGYLGLDMSRQLGVDVTSITERQKAATVAYERAMGMVAPPPNAAQSQFQRQLTGPSFTCPAPRDPLAQLICDTPALSRFDLLFVQTYQALRQQLADPALQQSLRQESLDFGRAVRSSCGIALAQSANSKQPMPPPAPPGAGSCVFQAYQQQRAIWQSRLIGAAAEEAARPLEQQVMLQSALERLKFLSTTDTFDGVFGSLTRAAIIAWQSSNGRETTGLLGNTDARELTQAAANYVETKEDQPKAQSVDEQREATVKREARRQELVAKYGDHADAIIAGNAQIGMTQEEVLEAKGAPTRKSALPPNSEVWVYDNYRVAFTDGKVTHAGH